MLRVGARRGRGGGWASTIPGMHRDLSEQQMLAWRRFLRAHALVTRRLEDDLVAEHRLPLASYDVLVQLVEAPERRLRMSELAERVLLSRSGLTRLVDRLEREGLVRREACEDDARGLFTVLTDGRVRPAEGRQPGAPARRGRLRGRPAGRGRGGGAGRAARPVPRRRVRQRRHAPGRHRRTGPGHGRHGLAADRRQRLWSRAGSVPSARRSSRSSSSWRSSERRKSRVATSPTAIRSEASSRVR